MRLTYDHEYFLDEMEIIRRYHYRILVDAFIRSKKRNDETKL